jgi:hypothetical protein
MIGEAQHRITVRLQPLRPCSVPRSLIVATVLVAIEFDDQLGGRTEEIDGVSTNRLLPAKPRAAELLEP